MNSEKNDKLKRIKEEILNFADSPLYSYRIENKYFPVMGEGNHDAKIMLVGEAPGENEAKTGRPFCGRAGKVLDELLHSVGIERKDVYITNIVKDRPPKNRDPLPDEIEAYAPFLDRQIDIIKPEIIATLGRFSMKYVMTRYGLDIEFDSISKIHGQIFQTSNFKLIPLYHPAAAIYNRQLLGVLKEDFRTLAQF